jgi:hypothetical protein
MKKRSCRETRVIQGFLGSLVRSRDRLINIRLVLIDTIRWFAARRGPPRLAENRTYVFVFVPVDFHKNGQARHAHITQELIGNGRHTADRGTSPLFSTLAALHPSASRTTAERDPNNPRELNHHLMWTWFLPNPLWRPNKNNCDFANLLRFGLNGFNANKTRRND